MCADSWEFHGAIVSRRLWRCHAVYKDPDNPNDTMLFDEGFYPPAAWWNNVIHLFSPRYTAARSLEFEPVFPEKNRFGSRTRKFYRKTVSRRDSANHLRLVVYRRIYCIYRGSIIFFIHSFGGSFFLDEASSSTRARDSLGSHLRARDNHFLPQKSSQNVLAIKELFTTLETTKTMWRNKSKLRGCISQLVPASPYSTHLFRMNDLRFHPAPDANLGGQFAVFCETTGPACSTEPLGMGGGGKRGGPKKIPIPPKIEHSKKRWGLCIVS